MGRTRGGGGGVVESPTTLRNVNIRLQSALLCVISEVEEDLAMNSGI